MITNNNGLFVLETDHTTYAFCVRKSGLLEHLYYGRKIHVHPEMMQEQVAFAPGNMVLYPWEEQLSPEDIKLEMSGIGMGDIREPFIECIFSDGSRTVDFVLKEAKILSEKEPFATLPGSIREKGEAEHLCLVLEERNHPVLLELHYYVYAGCDVITRSAKLVNQGSEPVSVERLMSLQMDFDDSEYIFTTFHGAWLREMEKTETKLSGGTYVNSSFTGTSSSRANPFVMLSRKNTDEESGEAFGFNLIYSGNHYEAAEVSSMGKLRLVSGINPASFSMLLLEGEMLEAPEAVMTYSGKGFQTLSANMHKFIRKHIVRGTWKDKERPILLNTWESFYFDINEAKVLKLAKKAAQAGVELLVVDDGWFDGRNDDKSALGDWTCDSKKFPKGLSDLADKINALGLDFGLWVEPEMVSPKSKLYQAHPEWVVDIPGQRHAEGRNQCILDLSNQAVQDYVIDTMSAVFSSANISYVKWDMNRNFSDYFSRALPPERQGEVAHRYVCGLYRCIRVLTEKFPDILFEGCASGGNRFDLGMLCYVPQIWASDNTDAYDRAIIQNHYSYGYPQSVISAHVSDSPNHQTLRRTPLSTRFHVASFAVLGYECNFLDLTKESFEAIKEQITVYKQWRAVLQYGNFYRISNFNEQDKMEWMIVAPDQKSAVGLQMYGLKQTNRPHDKFYAKGLLENHKYHFYNTPKNIDIRDFGSLINTVSPVHIKSGSLLQDVASKFVKMTEETEDYLAYGDTLMYAGVSLKQNYCATGYDEQVRLTKDFSSRIYFMD